MNYVNQFFTQERFNNFSKAIVEKTYEYPLPSLAGSTMLLIFGVQNMKAARGVISVAIGAFQLLSASIPLSRMIVNFQIFKDLVIADCKLVQAHLFKSEKTESQGKINKLKFQKIELKRKALQSDFKHKVDDTVNQAASKFKAGRRRRNSH